MKRLMLALLLGVVVLSLGGCASSLEDQRWPDFDFQRGPGGYLSWLKVAICWLLFLLWVRTTDWVSTDSQELKLEWRRWNPIVCGTFLGAFVLVWLLPWFWLSFSLLLAAYGVPLGMYVQHRNAGVPQARRVLTPEHMRAWFAQHMSKVGVQIAEEAAAPQEKGPPVSLTARGGATPHDDAARLAAAREAPGFNAARLMLFQGLARRATAIMLDVGAQSISVRHQVDGVWLDAPPLESTAGGPALEALMTLCGLNPAELQKRQQGAFTAQHVKTSCPATLTTQGVPTGQRALIQFEVKPVHFEDLAGLGMRPEIEKPLREVLGRTNGLLLLSAMPAGGLRSTTSVVLRSADRFQRDFMAVEDEKNRYEEIELIKVVTYNSAAGESPAGLLPKVFREEPAVVVVRDLVDGPSVAILCQHASQDRLIIGTVRAKDAAEALLRVLALKAPQAEFARAVTAVLGQRLIRKLCEKCKEAYPATPELLQQLRIPAGQVESLYRPPQPKPEEEKKKKGEPEICPECAGVGYKGRTAIFELFLVDDVMRKVLQTSPKLDLLRQAARKAGQRSLQEDGVQLVVQGITSLEEVIRVMKQ
jgi:type II secretory ATPase GspE/PulE/Tfp pilus assembly ATPase PilB-like protein